MMMNEYTKICLILGPSSKPLLYTAPHTTGTIAEWQGAQALEPTHSVHILALPLFWYLMLHNKPPKSLWPKMMVTFILLRNLRFG